MLIKPFLAKCSDRNSLAKMHPEAGDPDEWLNDDILGEFNLSAISFDFFVDWSSDPNILSPTIWIKRILKPEYSYDDLVNDLSNVMKNEFGKKKLNSLYSFSKKYQLDVAFIIFHDHVVWQNENSQLLVVSIKDIIHDEIIFNYELIDFKNFKDQIKKYSGGPVKIGRKGLIYSTSRLECFLSATDAAYPGDVDMIIIDKDDHPVCILEFKKHTLISPVSLQQLSNYYPHPDGRKYNRLAILKDHLSTPGFDIPLLNLYYPTQPKSTEGRLELLKGNAENLQTNVASNFDLPKKKEKEFSIPLIEKILKAVSWYASINNV